MTLSILKKKCVISLGGGAFLNREIRKEILNNHLSIWLKWDEDTLIKRIKNSKKRPVVVNLDENEIRKLSKERNKYYSKASIKIKCDNLSKSELLNRIIKLYEKL